MAYKLWQSAQLLCSGALLSLVRCIERTIFTSKMCQRPQSLPCARGSKYLSMEISLPFPASLTPNTILKHGT